MEIIAVLVLLALGGLALKKAFSPKISEGKRIYFSIIDDMHHGMSVEEIKDWLAYRYYMDDYESSMVVAAAIDGEMDYAIDFLETFLKKVAK